MRKSSIFHFLVTGIVIGAVLTFAGFKIFGKSFSRSEMMKIGMDGEFMERPSGDFKDFPDKFKNFSGEVKPE